MKLKWSVKGHSGLKPCFCCVNVIMKGHSAVSAHPSFVCLSDLDSSKFIAVSDEELWQTQDHLIAQQPLIKKGQLKELETASGQVCEPLGLMACQELRPFVKPSKTIYDSWHCYFVGGVAEIELDLLTQQLYNLGYTPAELENFCNDAWIPKQKLKFTDRGLKGMGSDVMRAVFLMHHMCVTVLMPAGVLPLECRSFCCLAKVVQCLQDMKLFEDIPAQLIDDLEKLQSRHGVLFKLAYGTGPVVPKHHYRMHVPGQTRKKKMQVDTAVVERKERLMKSEIQRLPRCDASQNINIHITVSVNLAQIDEMEHSPAFGALVGRTVMTENNAAR